MGHREASQLTRPKHPFDRLAPGHSRNHAECRGLRGQLHDPRLQQVLRFTP